MLVKVSSLADILFLPLAKNVFRTPPHAGRVQPVRKLLAPPSSQGDTQTPCLKLYQTTFTRASIRVWLWNWLYMGRATDTTTQKRLKYFEGRDGRRNEK
jgi:hypothetical protein